MDRGEGGTEQIVCAPRLGAHVETARIRAGLRRQALAEKLGGSEGTVRLWERGAVQPSPDSLARLIVVLAIDASQWSRPDESTAELPSLARRLRQERTQRGMTQAEVGRVLDVPQPTYAGWETGRTTPGTHFIPSIARFLEVGE